MSPEDRWNEAMRRSVQQTADALAEVNAAHPIPRVPLRKRILWRLFGVPDDVRRQQLALRKVRANAMLEGMQRLREGQRAR